MTGTKRALPRIEATPKGRAVVRRSESRYLRSLHQVEPERSPMMSSDRWIEVTASQFPWEQRALAWIRERIPDRSPYMAW